MERKKLKQHFIWILMGGPNAYSILYGRLLINQSIKTIPIKKI